MLMMSTTWWLLQIGAFGAVVYAASPRAVRTRYRLYRECGRSPAAAIADLLF
jgi:hypothetical protein